MNRSQLLEISQKIFNSRNPERTDRKLAIIMVAVFRGVPTRKQKYPQVTKSASRGPIANCREKRPWKNEYLQCKGKEE